MPQRSADQRRAPRRFRSRRADAARPAIGRARFAGRSTRRSAWPSPSAPHSRRCSNTWVSRLQVIAARLGRVRHGACGDPRALSAALRRPGTHPGPGALPRTEQPPRRRVSRHPRPEHRPHRSRNAVDRGGRPLRLELGLVSSRGRARQHATERRVLEHGAGGQRGRASHRRYRTGAGGHRWRVGGSARRRRCDCRRTRPRPSATKRRSCDQTRARAASRCSADSRSWSRRLRPIRPTSTRSSSRLATTPARSRCSSSIRYPRLHDRGRHTDRARHDQARRGHRPDPLDDRCRARPGPAGGDARRPQHHGT